MTRGDVIRHNRSRMIIKALVVSRKYKLTGFDKLMIILLKGNIREHLSKDTLMGLGWI